MRGVPGEPPDALRSYSTGQGPSDGASGAQHGAWASSISALSASRLLVEHAAHVLAAEHDALEGVGVDLVELAAEVAEADRQQRRHRVARAGHRGDRRRRTP